MEPIQHAIGLCHDNHTHFDLIDLLVGGGIGAGIASPLVYLRVKIFTFFKKLLARFK